MVGISWVGKPIYGFGTALPVITPSFRPVEAISREIITQRPQMILGNGRRVGCHTLEVTDHMPFSDAGVRTTLAPRKRINLRRSTLKFSAIVTTGRVIIAERLRAEARRADPKRD